MDEPPKERWFQLCQLAAVEQDPEKLLALFVEIDNLLEKGEAEGSNTTEVAGRGIGKSLRVLRTAMVDPIGNSQDARRFKTRQKP